MVKGFPGSLGAARRAVQTDGCPSGLREDIWRRLKKWAVETIKKYEGEPECYSLHRALWDTGKAGYGLKVNVRDIPFEQEAVEVSEALGLNIFDLESADFEAGIFKTDDAEGYTCIGCILDGNDKLLINAGEISYLNRP